MTRGWFTEFTVVLCIKVKSRGKRLRSNGIRPVKIDLTGPDGNKKLNVDWDQPQLQGRIDRSTVASTDAQASRPLPFGLKRQLRRRSDKTQRRPANTMQD